MNTMKMNNSVHRDGVRKNNAQVVVLTDTRNAVYSHGELSRRIFASKYAPQEAFPLTRKGF